MEPAIFLATCLNAADLASLYYSFEPTFYEREIGFDELEADLITTLMAEVEGDGDRFLAAMHEGFRRTLEIPGTDLLAFIDTCRDGPPPQ